MTYTIELTLDSRGLDGFIEKRFFHAYKLKREVINYFNRQEHHRQNSDEYKRLSQEMQNLDDLKKQITETKDKNEKDLLKQEYKNRQAILKNDWINLNNSFNLDSSKFVKYKTLGQATNMYQRYAQQGLILATTFQDIAQTVKDAYLTRRKQSNSVNQLFVPRYVDFTTMWLPLANPNVKNNGLIIGKGKNRKLIPYKFRNSDEEIRFTYALQMQKLRLHGLKRTRLKNDKWKYSVLLVFDGVPYGTLDTLPNTGEVNITVDINTLELVASSNGQTERYDLSNDFGYSEKLSELDRQIERSRRYHNPQNYNPNGTIKSGKLKWTYTKRYHELLAKKRKIWHKIKASRKHRFGQISNHILTLGDTFNLKQADFKTLQARKKFDPQTMSWYNTRKQHGFEIMFNAPHEFITILENKLSFHDIKLNKTK